MLTTNANDPSAVLDVDTSREVEVANGLRVRYCRRLVRHSVSPMLLRLLPSYVRWGDIVHLTAVYSFPTIPTLLACKILRKPIVWSPRGALQRWEGSTRLREKALWERVCQVVAPKPLVLHVTSEEEARESLERLPGVEVAVISNGIEILEKVTHIHGEGMLRLLYLGRLHPKKGIENLLAACAMLNNDSGFPWSLTIAGAGDPGYTRNIRARIKELALSGRVRMVGWVAGEAKQKLFHKADILVVPSFTENFGIVVAEALAHGVPVIASKGTPWSRMEDIGCGLWLGNDPASLKEGIERMSRMPLREMGLSGREWMKREFSWSRVAESMMALYEGIQDDAK